MVAAEGVDGEGETVGSGVTERENINRMVVTPVLWLSRLENASTKIKASLLSLSHFSLLTPQPPLLYRYLCFLSQNGRPFAHKVCACR